MVNLVILGFLIAGDAMEYSSGPKELLVRSSML